jgi:hypothetical protein
MFAASLQETIVDAMLSWREVDQKICLPGPPARSYLRGAHMLFAVASIVLALVILSVRSWLKKQQLDREVDMRLDAVSK